MIVALAGLAGMFYGGVDLIDSLLYSMHRYELDDSTPAFFAVRGAIELAIGWLVMTSNERIALAAFKPAPPPRAPVKRSDTARNATVQDQRNILPDSPPDRSRANTAPNIAGNGPHAGACFY